MQTVRFDFDLAVRRRLVGGLRLADDVERQLRCDGARAERDAGALQERAAVYGAAEHPADRTREPARRRAVSGRTPWIFS